MPCWLFHVVVVTVVVVSIPGLVRGGLLDDGHDVDLFLCCSPVVVVDVRVYLVVLVVLHGIGSALIVRVAVLLPVVHNVHVQVWCQVGCVPAIVLGHMHVSLLLANQCHKSGLMGSPPPGDVDACPLVLLPGPGFV